MTTQTTTGGQKQQGLRGVLAMTALTVAVLGALVLWQVGRGGGDAAAPLVGSPRQGTETAAAAPTSGPPAQAAAARTTEIRVYIVESQERAQLVRAGIEEFNAQRAALGQPRLEQQVVWFDSADAEADFQQSLSWVHAVSGVPSTAIIDLRGGPTSRSHRTDTDVHLEAGAGAGSVVPVAVDTIGGMAELYRDQRHVRGICGEEEQSISC